MTRSTMSVFQTYQALLLKRMWQEDLKELNNAIEKVQYKLCLPWKNFLGLSVELALLINVFLLSVGITEYGVLALPLLLFASLLISLEPLAYLLIPIAIYNVLKVQYNKIKNKSNPDLVKIRQEEESIKINLETIQNGLENHSIVPTKYQSEDELQEMMEEIKSGRATNDSHAVYLHAINTEMKQRKENKAADVRKSNGRMKVIFKNLIIIAFFYQFSKKILSKPD